MLYEVITGQCAGHRHERGLATAFVAERQETGRKHRHEQTGQQLAAGVITSYSIHYTKLYENIREALALRDFMADMRDNGQVSGGPAALSKTDVQAFANRLDTYLARHAPRSAGGA